MRTTLLVGLVAALTLTACTDRSPTLAPAVDRPRPELTTTSADPGFILDTVAVLERPGAAATFWSGLHRRGADELSIVIGGNNWDERNADQVARVDVYDFDGALQESIQIPAVLSPGFSALPMTHAWLDDGTLFQSIANEGVVAIRAPDGTLTLELGQFFFDSPSRPQDPTAPFANPLAWDVLPRGTPILFSFASSHNPDNPEAFDYAFIERLPDGTWRPFGQPNNGDGAVAVGFEPLTDNRVVFVSWSPTLGLGLFVQERGEAFATLMLPDAPGFPVDMERAPSAGPVWSQGDILYPIDTHLVVVSSDLSGFQVFPLESVLIKGIEFGPDGTLWLHDTQGGELIAVRAPPCTIEDVIGRVDALEASGTLSKGLANSLRVKLEAAIRQRDRQNTRAASNQIDAFINQTEALVRSGELSSADGDDLIQCAQEAQDGL